MTLQDSLSCRTTPSGFFSFFVGQYSIFFYWIGPLFSIGFQIGPLFSIRFRVGPLFNARFQVSLSLFSFVPFCFVLFHFSYVLTFTLSI
ncbi:hypothetical protein RIR_e35280_A0A2I1FMA0_9GLOM [Rhizophagus irregularis DAOM 181602=DAOM 197198]|nr:hypothetical protein RIR_e35280_A0A2I1FMA0_9GLOM [Rhizophagus irregularis DAOM 181602=DAOM 197198]